MKTKLVQMKKKTNLNLFIPPCVMSHLKVKLSLKYETLDIGSMEK